MDEIRNEPDPQDLYKRLKASPDHIEDGAWKYTMVDPALVLEILVYLEERASEGNG